VVGLARSASEFFRNESCGKCVPCRLGTQQLAELAARLDEGGYTPEQWDAERPDALIEGLAASMEMTSICGLGRIAANPLTTLLAHFPDDVRRRLVVVPGPSSRTEASR
jgi:NADH:ubiquinone oxidoreductase subunit F (NADH-binding)